MKNKFEHILLSLLLGTSILLGLSFWLNTNYGFNLFSQKHWAELAQLQATHTPVSHGFYISIIVAIVIFVMGIYAVYHHKTSKPNANTIKYQPNNILPPVQNTDNKIKSDSPVPVPNIPIARPPRLNLPNNMAQIVAQKQSEKKSNLSTPQNNVQQNPYTPLISKIFSENGYLVKQNPKISGFTPDLFAIGTNEILWIGTTDTKTDDLQHAIDKLRSVFQETLEDIQININAFVLDTMNQCQPTDSILIFKSIDELQTFISENPAEKITDDERDNFNSYSEYIDTVIQYIKNI